MDWFGTKKYRNDQEAQEWGAKAMRQVQRSGFEPNDDFGFRRGENSIGMDENEQALWDKARSMEDRAAIMQQRDARRLQEHKDRERQEWQKTPAGQLLKKLGECFAKYRECLEQDPRLEEKALAFDEVNQKIFNKMRTTLERANNAPRCRFEKGNGMPCRAPRVRGKKYCHM